VPQTPVARFCLDGHRNGGPVQQASGGLNLELGVTVAGTWPAADHLGDQKCSAPATLSGQHSSELVRVLLRHSQSDASQGLRRAGRQSAARTCPRKSSIGVEILSSSVSTLNLKCHSERHPCHLRCRRRCGAGSARNLGHACRALRACLSKRRVASG